MAVYESIKTVTVTAGSDILLCRFVALAADGKYDHVGTAQVRADGVSAEGGAADGETFPMALMQGLMKVEAGAAVSVGAQVASDDEGRAIAHVDTAGNYILGEARSAASDAGEFIEVLLSKHQDGA